MFALLLWSLLSAMGLFYGTAVCAQLEAVRAGHPDPAYDDTAGRTASSSTERREAAVGAQPRRSRLSGSTTQASR